MEEKQKLGPRDVFLHLLSVIALYVCAVNFGVLLFQYINLAFPDVLDFPRYSLASLGPLRWAIASLTIIFPLYVFLQRFLERELTRVPEKRGLRTRHWLIIFTMSVAAMIIAGDLVSLLYNFLQGDLTLRFSLKVLAVLFIAGAVLGYYGGSLRRDAKPASMPWMKPATFGVVGLVVCATLVGFFVVGSPARERLRRLDERRVQDLQNIQWQVVEFWQQKEKMPQTLDDLKDSISGYTPSRDPKTGEAYEYRVFESLRFELCANFQSESAAKGDISQETPVSAPPLKTMPTSQDPSLEYWVHDTGRECFDRAIDPVKYKPYNKSVPNN